MVIRRERALFSGRKELPESFRWLFVGLVPLLHRKSRVARQFQVEMWLDLSAILKELEIRKIDTLINRPDKNTPLQYIV